MQKLVLIDGNAILHRGFHALPPFRTKKGEITNAIFGFTQLLFSILDSLRPEYILVTFDRGEPTFRHKAFAAYKAHREEAPQELYDQLPRVKELLCAFGIPIFEAPGFEADDLLATLATQGEKQKNLYNIIITGDLDTLQLVSPRTVVMTPQNGFRETFEYTTAAVKKRYGLSPAQMVDFKALRGDPSDNIPGVYGIGEKTASELLQKYKTIEGIYKHLDELSTGVRKKMEEGKKAAFESRDLVQLRHDAPAKLSLSACAIKKQVDFEKVETLFQELEFKNFLKRLPELAKNLGIPYEPKVAQQSLF